MLTDERREIRAIRLDIVADDLGLHYAIAHSLFIFRVFSLKLFEIIVRIASNHSVDGLIGNMHLWVRSVNVFAIHTE